MHFHHNKAVKRGGAIFVEDLNDMNSVTHRPGAVFFIRRPRDTNMSGHIFISPQIQISQYTAQIAENDILEDGLMHTCINLVSWILPRNDLYEVPLEYTYALMKF